jgi:hypothetical protein
MIKRTLAIIILFSMVIHCASRLGFLSYLYENRTQIANTLGLISEVPIAFCSSDYTFNETLPTQPSDSETGIPVSFSSAHEITLFIQNHFAFSGEPINVSLMKVESHYSIPHYLSPHLDIFQPPRIS